MRPRTILAALFVCSTLCAQVYTPSPVPKVPTPDIPGAATADVGTPKTNTPDSMARLQFDRNFVKEAAMADMTQVELGKLATQKGSSDAIKQFGQKMIDDHGKSDNELKKLAGDDKLEVPDSLDAKHKASVAKLAKLSGTAFDKAYVKEELKDHQQDLNQYQQEATTGADRNVKEFAEKTVPALKQHLSMVKDLDKDLRASK